MAADETNTLTEERAPQLSGVELFTLAERVVSWEDDTRRSELRYYSELYAQAAQQAHIELEQLALTARPTPARLAALGPTLDLRSQLLVQRAQTSALIARLERARSARVRRPRWVYAGLALTLLVVAWLGAMQARDPLVTHFDLGNVSSKKPWRCSSGASPAMPLHGTLDEPLGSYFFFTATEHEPWLEIDLQRETRIRSALIRNRQDCCKDRALPLVLEVSKDREHWQKLAEQALPFNTWHVHLPATLTRWVRLRVQAESALHLHSVILRRL